MKKIISTLLCVLATAIGCTIKAQNDMDNALDNKQRNLVLIASFEAKGDIDRLKSALIKALDDGLTVNEAKEALSHLYAYTGFPRSLNGLNALQEVLAERHDKGIRDNEGKDATPLPADFDALRQGTEVQTQLSGKPFEYKFAPATDYYLKAHLFGDIFARDILTFAERELVTLGALSSIEGAQSQLVSHITDARNMGVSETQLQAIPMLLSTQADKMAGYRFAQALAKAEGKPFGEGKPLENQIFPTGTPNTAYAQYFVGNSYLAPLLSEGLHISNVTFEPRCRNNWHIHHKGGQVLICVGGEGWYQEWGKPAQKLRPGDVVNIPAEVKHWHGAAADTWFQHIAIAVPAEGATNEWLEPMSDDEYDKLK